MSVSASSAGSGCEAQLASETLSAMCTKSVTDPRTCGPPTTQSKPGALIPRAAGPIEEWNRWGPIRMSSTSADQQTKTTPKEPAVEKGPAEVPQESKQSVPQEAVP